MECVVVKLKEAITDPTNSLPVLGGIRFKLDLSAATSIKVTAFRIGTINDGVVISVSSGNFYSNTAGTTLLGKTVTKTGTWTNNQVYFKPDNLVDTVYVSIRNSANITNFGSPDENAQWGPTGTFLADVGGGVLGYKFIIDADELYNLPNLKNFVIGGGFDIINVKQIHFNQLVAFKVIMVATLYLLENVELTGGPTVLRGINAGKSSSGSTGTLTVDLNKMDILNIELGGSVNVIYTGTGMIALSTGVISYLSINSAIASSTQFDNLIKALALSTYNSNILTCRILGTRTSASDAALATLRTKVPAGKLYLNNVLEN
jgi:hypothetical protein